MSRVIIVFLVAFLPIYSNIPVFAGEPLADFSGIKELITGQPDDEEIRDNIYNIEDLIKEDPENYEAYEMLAFSYDYLGLYAKALEAMKLQIKYTPGKSEWDVIYGNLAREYLNLNRVDEVKKPSLKSLKFNPKDIDSRVHLLDYYALKGRYKEAGVEFKTLCELDKDYDFYHEAYKGYLDKIQNKNDLTELFREAVKANPDSYLSHRVLAIAIRDSSLEDVGKNLPAIMESFNKALKLNPKYIPTYIGIAGTYTILGVETKKEAYFNEALRWVNKAYKLDSDNLRLAYSTGYIYLAMGKYDKAIEKLEYTFYHGAKDETIDLLIRAYNGKAYSYYKSGKNLKRGLKIIDKAIALKHDNGILLSTKAELLYKMERYDEAYEYIKKGIKLEPNEPEIKQDLENIEKALKEAKK